MKIPKTTTEHPYIEFMISKTGTVKLSKSNNYWGGKNAGFHSSNGYVGNTCPPSKLNEYLNHFLNKREKDILKEIAQLEKTLEKTKKLNKLILSNYENNQTSNT